MPLAAGSRLGPYEIIEPLGKGGMGEVYRARDSKLGREVAIKVLPEELSRDEARLARFEREARVLASLNHPAIASIYGVEESAGRTALVLELVEGPTLAERIAKGPLPLDEAVAVARQIAEALEAGHEAGVIHRDLKPSNVKVKDGGTVKVLDYGLAKALETNAATEPSNLSQSPTLTRQGTALGVILGTAAYMSPEQARGKRADVRADIWAFGTVLFEMLTGKPLFTGDTVSDVLGAVLRDELDWSRLPDDAPEPIRRLLRRCLTRDPARRLPHIGAARLELDEAVATPEKSSPRGTDRSRLWIGAVGAALGLLAGLGLYGILAAPASPPSPIRASIALPPGTQLAFGPSARNPMALSPDGSTLAFVTAPVGTALDLRNEHPRETRIYVRRLDSGETTPLRDTEGAMHLFFSPDGRSIGFFAQGELKTISVTGGAPVRICPVSNPWGAVWTEDDRVVFSEPGYREEGGGSGLFVVSAHGGERSVYSTPDPLRGEIDHEFPTALPGSSDLLVTMWVEKAYPNARVGLLPAGGGPVTHLFEGGSNAHAFREYLVYARTPQLLAVAFDAKTRRLTGNPQVILDDVLGEPNYLTPQFTLSPSGVLIWAAGESAGSGKLFRLQGEGSPRLELLVSDARVREGHMFPGGSLVALNVTEANDAVYAYDTRTEILTRVTSQLAASGVAAPDDDAVFYSSAQGFFRQDLRRQDPAIIWNETGDLTSISADAIYLAYSYVETGKSDSDIGILDVRAARGRPFLATPAIERNPMFSPTSPVIAYVSDDMQQAEVWLQRFDPKDAQPVTDAPVRVSRDGGSRPFWSADGRSLYFTSGNERLMAAKLETTPKISVARPVEVLDLGPSLLSTAGIGRLDVFGQDGDGRFLAVGVPPIQSITQLEAIFHFRPELVNGSARSRRAPP
ncbi:MAG: protein kinase domain-containing protein [Vicinamibacteria bacterium]